jgi:uncharacterized protein
MFEYDPDKNEINIMKHGLSLETAQEIFDDPYKITIDAKEVAGEKRENTIGIIERYGIIASVIHTDREGNKRLISARAASRTEQKIYKANRERLGG